MHNRRDLAYQAAVAAFDWADVLADLGWTGAPTVDLAWTIVDRHARGASADRTAVHWVGSGWQRAPHQRSRAVAGECALRQSVAPSGRPQGR